MCNRKYSREIWIGACVAGFQNLCGCNLVVYYSNALFAQGNKSWAPYLALISSVVHVLAAAPSIPLMKYARRPLLIWGYAGLWFFDYVAAILGFFNVSWIA